MTVAVSKAYVVNDTAAIQDQWKVTTTATDIQRSSSAVRLAHLPLS